MLIERSHIDIPIFPPLQDVWPSIEQSIEVYIISNVAVMRSGRNASKGRATVPHYLRAKKKKALNPKVNFKLQTQYEYPPTPP